MKTVAFVHSSAGKSILNISLNMNNYAYLLLCHIRMDNNNFKNKKHLGNNKVFQVGLLPITFWSRRSYKFSFHCKDETKRRSLNLGLIRLELLSWIYRWFGNTGILGNFSLFRKSLIFVWFLYKSVLILPHLYYKYFRVWF